MFVLSISEIHLLFMIIFGFEITIHIIIKCFSKEASSQHNKQTKYGGGQPEY